MWVGRLRPGEVATAGQLELFEREFYISHFLDESIHGHLEL